MKILLVTNDFPPKVGGADDYVAQIARRFAPGEITVVASTSPGAEAFDAGFPQRVVRVPVRKLLPTPMVRARTHDLVRTEQADVVLFGASMPLALMGARITRDLSVPYTTFTHGVEIAASRLPFGRAALRRIGHTAALITVVSRWTRARLAPFVGPATRLEVLPSGIDAAAFYPGVASDGVRARYGLGSGPVISCVSRLVPRKGQDKLIRALPRITQDFPSTRLLIVGGGRDESRLRTLARQLRTDDRVVFAGEVPYGDLPAHFAVGDVFAMPCRSRRLGLETEALGAVYLQAAGVGRVSIAGRVGGAPEAVRHGETGLVIDGRSVQELTAAVLELLRDPDRARRMGAAGAQWVHRELTWDRVTARLRGWLEQIVGGPRGG
ncbi:MAG: glycosyltransferase family 4 protein [Candidatus Rokuibacteriota bacterium]